MDGTTAHIRRSLALTGVKCVHTLIWALVESAVVYLIAAGWRGRSDRRAAVMGSIVATESLIFLGNGARCPLTSAAESLGAERGSVTDIFLPRRLAHWLPVIHVPLVGLIVYLHARNLRRAARAGHPAARGLPGGRVLGGRAQGSDPFGPGPLAPGG